MSLINTLSLSFSPYGAYNCSLTTFPEKLTSEAYEEHKDYRTLVTSCLIQFKKTFCSHSLAKKFEAKFWVDRCVYEHRIAERKNADFSSDSKEMQLMSDIFGVQKGALILLAGFYSHDENNKLESLLKAPLTENFKNYVRLKLAIKEERFEEAALIREKIEEREEKIASTMDLFLAHSNQCHLDEVKPLLNFLEEKLPQDALVRLPASLPYNCLDRKMYDETFDCMELKNQKGEPYFQQKEKSDFHENLANFLLIDVKFAFRASDEKIREMLAKPMSIFKKIKDDNGKLIFAKKYIEACESHDKKDLAIEIAEKIENDPNRIEAFQFIYKSFKEKKN